MDDFFFELDNGSFDFEAISEQSSDIMSGERAVYRRPSLIYEEKAGVVLTG